MPGLVFVNGVAVRTNAETGEQTLVYPGSLHGSQFIGEGKGADFIARNWLKNNAFKANYGPQEGFEGFCPPCGVALFCPSELAVNPEDGPEIPLAIVNGPENVQEVADSYNRGSISYELVRDPEVTGFDAELVVKLYDDVVGAYHFAQTAFRKSPQYTISGIREYNGKRTVSTGNTLEYYGYIPEELDLTVPASVPLFMYFHGGGGEGEAMLDWTDWVKVGKEKGFAVLSVDQHYAYTSNEVIELLDQLIAENPWIDTTRIYAGGFSMGGGKTWNLAVKFPERLAGVVPTAAGWMNEGEGGWGAPMDESIIKEGVLLPVFYVGGGASFLPEFPAAEPTNVNAVMKAVWKMNNLGEYAFDEASGSRWGAAPYSTEALQNFDNVGTIQQLVIDSFRSPDGNIYTCLCTDRNMPHNQSGKNAHVAWEFISKFSRAADGTLVIGE
jgi:pimeloyl-ACP methyl ester carboxylesterase